MIIVKAPICIKSPIASADSVGAIVRRIAVKGLESPSRVSSTMCARARQHRERCKEHEGAMQERERPRTHRLPARGEGSDP